MTETINRQLVLDLLDTFYSGDVAGTLARCSDDVSFVANAPIDILPHMGARQGKAAVKEMWDTVHARYSSTRHEVRTMVAEGDIVAADLRVFFRKRSNQRIVQFDIAAFYTLRDGLVSRIREIIDTYDLVQQVLERDVGEVLTDARTDGA